MTEARNNSVERRTYLLVLAILCLYLVAIVILAINGRFVFFNKTLIIPVLVLVTAATRDFTRFAHQWSIFLSIVILFDGLRGYVYQLIMMHDLPVYMNYVARSELTLFGGTIPTLSLQNWLFADRQLGLLESVLTIVHGSHFLFFLLFGFLLWSVRREEFPRFRAGMLLIMLLGLIGYLTVPTVPPWMAAEQYDVFPRIDRIYMQVYNLNAPVLNRVFAFNPIAAMPSLHTAFPAFIALVSLRIWRRVGLIAIAYLLVMAFALVYGGEHYIVDEIAGAAMAILVYFVVYRYRTPRFLARLRDRLFEHEKLLIAGRSLWGKLALAVLILLAAEGMDHVSTANFRAWEPTDEFIRRELLGTSPKAHLLLGGSAFNRNDYRTAAREFQAALAELEKQEDIATAWRFLALSAYHNRDLDLAVRAFSNIPLHRLSVVSGITFARCYFESDRRREGISVLTAFEQAHGKTLETIGEKYNMGWLHGLVSDDELSADLAFLGTMPDNSEARRLADNLRNLPPNAETEEAP